VKPLDQKSAVLAGGWDPRYAVALVVVTRGDIAAALIDPNGDGADIDLDEYTLGPDGEWVAGNSGGSAGDSGSSWSPAMVTKYGRTTPGAIVQLGYRGERHQVTANNAGWWLFITPAEDDSSLVETRFDS
jgi:hypothetical protein